MNVKPIQLTFMLDEGVPIAVGEYLEGCGHNVIFFKDVLPISTPDPVVCRTAMENDAILIVHDSDMEKLILKRGENHHYRSLNLLRVRCVETRAVDRVGRALNLMVREWCHEKYPRGRTLRMEIRADTICLFR